MQNTIHFNDSIKEKDQKIILEEERNLLKITSSVSQKSFFESRETLLQQIFDIRTAMSDASESDLAHLTDQMTRLTALVNQLDRSNIDGIDLENPYFGHVKLEEKEQKREFYIGTRVYRTPDKSVVVLDWKTSPIAQVYFRYEEDEEYEEEIGGQMIEGVVNSKRMLKVIKGVLVALRQGSTLFEKNEDGVWFEKSSNQHRLHGGSGTATRPENMKRKIPKLGSKHNRDKLTESKFLSDITGLMDPEQYKLITHPANGIVAIQGAAGSGKTTVALHRVAWLHSQSPKRFAPEKIAIMVFNKALANYISKVLPSLGVNGVKIYFFEEWVATLRSGIFGRRLPKLHSEHTPVSVIRLKKHAEMLSFMNAFLDQKKLIFKSQVQELMKVKQIEDFPLEHFSPFPLVKGVMMLLDWIEGRIELNGKRYSYSAEITTVLYRLIDNMFDRKTSRQEIVLQFWEELFTDFIGLKNWFLEKAGNDFTEIALNEAIYWIKKQYISRADNPSKTEDALATGEVATLDYEDDPILLFLYQKLLGGIKGKGQGEQQFAHLMIDEAQDLSPIELSVLVKMAKSPRSVTLAGDVNQQMIQHGGFQDWNRMFAQLGLEGQQLSILNVTYRSTAQIMDFAYEVLGDTAKNKSYQTTREGDPVEVCQFAHQGEMVQFLATALRDLVLEEGNASVAVICFTPQDAENYFRIMENMDVAKLRLVADQDFSFTSGIDVTDIKQVKGLEFDYVVLLDVDSVNYSLNTYNRYLLHIGATRAAHQLWILNYRVPSPLLPSTAIDQNVI